MAIIACARFGHRFNPRPREGANDISLRCPVSRTGFNPRPREGANENADKARVDAHVSIRAPVRGRTGDVLKLKGRGWG